LNHVPTEQSVLTYYTDGSRKDGMTGMGKVRYSVRYYEALGASTTIFQTEMYAINARICLNTEGLAGKHVCIISDSQAVLKASGGMPNNLKRLTTKSELTFM
jgi:hypothetical protein